MFSWGKRKAALRALGRKVPVKALPDVRSLFLLQMVIGLSEALNGSAAQMETVARALMLDGQQRLHALRKAAPHLDLSLDRLLSTIRSHETPDDPLSPEESAVQAMFEVCLGLMLRWLSKRDDYLCPQASSITARRVFSFDVPLPSCDSFSQHLFRARSCLIS